MSREMPSDHERIEELENQVKELFILVEALNRGEHFSTEVADAEED